MVKITLLVDDLNGSLEGYTRSYGFSALIELEGQKILFDAGTHVKPLIGNLKRYGCPPQEIDCVILSHNHYDHTDGLPGILNENKKIPVFVHKQWDAKVSFKGFQVPRTNKKVIKNARALSEISENIFITNVYHSHDYGGIQEHACYVQAEDLYILISGCCHPGLNIYLKDRKDLDIPLDAPLSIIGGYHGFSFTDQEAKKLSPQLNEIIVCHCTSKVKQYQQQFKEKCSIGIVGKTYPF